MKYAKSRKSVFCVWMLLLASNLLIGSPDYARATENPIGRYVFEYCHRTYSTSGGLDAYKGFFIDQEGLIWSYDHGDIPKLPTGTEGHFSERDLDDKYRNVQQIGNVDKSVFLAMATFIQPASQGETRQTGRKVAGMDSISYTAYLYDSVQGLYKEVVLKVLGSEAIYNSASAAHRLVIWLETVFFKNSAAPVPDPSEVPPNPMRTSEPTLKIIQKIPAPKPEIQVEIRGPFPVEDQSK